MASSKDSLYPGNRESPKVQRGSRPRAMSIAATSKVREYIQRVKRSDEEHRKTVVPPQKMLTWEELYETDEGALKNSDGESTPELSQTLRALKEKDILIAKLTQSCSDLAIKYASAENTIDELRFGSIRRLSRHGSTASLLNVNQVFPVPAPVTRKDVSVETETEVLEESSVDWLEKVQNWRADVTFNASHEESCGDSGFRGSELELSRIPSVSHPNIGTQTPNILISKCAQDFARDPLGDANELLNSTTISESHRILAGPSSSKTARTLDALLEDATMLAKRVKEKSQRLAEILKES